MWHFSSLPHHIYIGGLRTNSIFLLIIASLHYQYETKDLHQLHLFLINMSSCDLLGIKVKSKTPATSFILLSTCTRAVLLHAKSVSCSIGAHHHAGNQRCRATSVSTQEAHSPLLRTFRHRQIRSCHRSIPLPMEPKYFAPAKRDSQTRPRMTGINGSKSEIIIHQIIISPHRIASHNVNYPPS